MQNNIAEKNGVFVNRFKKYFCLIDLNLFAFRFQILYLIVDNSYLIMLTNLNDKVKRQKDKKDPKQK